MLKGGQRLINSRHCVLDRFLGLVTLDFVQNHFSYPNHEFLRYTIMSTASSNDGNVAVTTESQAELVIILSVVFTATSTVVFGLRLFTRCVLLKTAGPDDWTMLVAQILAILVGVATSLGKAPTTWSLSSL